jgi:hypothetical protein
MLDLYMIAKCEFIAEYSIIIKYRYKEKTLFSNRQTQNPENPVLPAEITIIMPKSRKGTPKQFFLN